MILAAFGTIIIVSLLAQLVLFSLAQQLRTILCASAPNEVDSYFAATDMVLWQTRPLFCGLRFLPLFKPAPPQLSESREFAIFLGQARIAASLAVLGYVFAAFVALLGLAQLAGG